MCDHFNCTIFERTMMIRQIEFKDCEVTLDPGDEPEDVDRHYEVECHDCGLTGHYAESKLPKWVKRRMLKATRTSDTYRYPHGLS